MESAEESMDRMDQIVRVDATALLKTIRELEYKLSDHQMEEKLPGWAVALTQRIGQIEDTLHEQNIILPTVGNNGTVLNDGGVGSSVDSTGERKRNVEDLAYEMRVFAKVRKEMENKVNSAEVNLEAKMSSFNLQIDRLHKLLQIRPTTSELQQVINAVHEIEKKVFYTVDDLKGDIKATLRDKISSEMVSIINEIKSSKDFSDNSIKYIQSTVDSYAVDMADIRQITENAIKALNEEMVLVRENCRLAEEKIILVKLQADKEATVLHELVAEIKQEQRNSAEQLNIYKRRAAEEVSKIHDSIQEESIRVSSELLRVEADIAECKSSNLTTISSMRRLENTYDSDMGNIKMAQSALKDDLAQQEQKVSDLNNMVQELIAYDFDTRIQSHDDMLSKINFDITDLQRATENVIQSELKNVNVKVALLQEQCNIQIPAAYGEMNIRIDKLFDRLVHTHGMIELMKEKIDATDTTLGELLPLVERVSYIEACNKESDKEIASLKEAMINAIDNADEMVRRMDEVEETVEGMDETITTRMNQVRDALMDTLLEKQTETNVAMRSVRENLEVMAMIGDGGGANNGKGGGGRNRKIGRNTVNGGSKNGLLDNGNGGIDEDPDGTGSVASLRRETINGGAGGTGSNMKRESAILFKRPTMAGAVVHGAPVPTLPRTPGGTFIGGGGSLLEGNSSNSMDGSNSAAAAAIRSRGFIAAGNRNESRGGVSTTNSNNSSRRTLTGEGSQIGSFKQQRSGSGRVRRGSSAGNKLISMNSSRLSSPNGSDIDAYSRPGSSHQPTGFDSPNGSTLFASLDGVDDPNNYNADTDNENNNDSNSSIINSNYNAAPVSAVSAAVASTSSANSSSNNIIPQPQIHSQQQPVQLQQGYARFTAPSQQPESLGQEYSELLGSTNNHALKDYPHFTQAQYVSDLCINFEEISMKRKRVAAVPDIMCESIADVAQDLSEYMAKSADFEMVEHVLVSAGGSITAANNISYDENFVISNRQHKMDEYLHNVAQLVVSSSSQPVPGIIRMDARTLFLSLVKKALEMFMSKHNQVLMAGNSRLGRVKIPSCIACDRPLIDKVRLDTLVSRGGTAASLGGSSEQHGLQPMGMRSGSAYRSAGGVGLGGISGGGFGGSSILSYGGGSTFGGGEGSYNQYARFDNHNMPTNSNNLLQWGDSDDEDQQQPSSTFHSKQQQQQQQHSRSISESGVSGFNELTVSQQKQFAMNVRNNMMSSNNRAAAAAANGGSAVPNLVPLVANNKTTISSSITTPIRNKSKLSHMNTAKNAAGLLGSSSTSKLPEVM